MGKKRPSREALEVENRNLKKQYWAQAVGQFCCTLVKWGGLCIIFGFLYLSVRALAGQNTNANINLPFLDNFALVAAIASGGGGVVWGMLERNLRKQNVRRMGEQIRRLESQRDPNRSSSELTETGDTNPDDEI